MNNYNNPDIGFERGNLFDNLYLPYKNYKIDKINPKNEKEYLMYIVQVYDFAINDLGLYLDNYPNDSEKINLRNTYLLEYQKAYDNYESKYGPLDLTSNYLNKTPWCWVSSFPWEVDNV